MLGIFQTKKATYNKLVLKSLLYGPKTTKQIAEYIKQNTAKPKNLNRLISEISRKGSRLNELETKQYIIRENSLWKLTIKGEAVALTLIDSVYDVMPYILEQHKQTIPELDKLVSVNPFLKQILNENILREFLKIASTPELYQRIKDITNRLIKVGVNLDDMTGLEFQNILGSELFSSFIRQRSLNGTNLSKFKNVLLKDLERYEKELRKSVKV